MNDSLTKGSDGLSQNRTAEPERWAASILGL